VGVGMLGCAEQDPRVSHPTMITEQKHLSGARRCCEGRSGAPGGQQSCSECDACWFGGFGFGGFGWVRHVEKQRVA